MDNCNWSAKKLKSVITCILNLKPQVNWALYHSSDPKYYEVTHNWGTLVLVEQHRHYNGFPRFE